MRDMNGVQILGQLKSNSRTCDVPVVILSSLEDPDFEATAKQLGASGYLSKPLSPPALISEVAGVLDKSAEADF